MTGEYTIIKTIKHTMHDALCITGVEIRLP